MGNGFAFYERSWLIDVWNVTKRQSLFINHNLWLRLTSDPIGSLLLTGFLKENVCFIEGINGRAG